MANESHHLRACAFITLIIMTHLNYDFKITVSDLIRIHGTICTHNVLDLLLTKYELLIFSHL